MSKLLHLCQLGINAHRLELRGNWPVRSYPMPKRNVDLAIELLARAALKLISCSQMFEILEDRTQKRGEIGAGEVLGEEMEAGRVSQPRRLQAELFIALLDDLKLGPVAISMLIVSDVWERKRVELSIPKHCHPPHKPASWVLVTSNL